MEALGHRDQVNQNPLRWYFKDAFKALWISSGRQPRSARSQPRYAGLGRYNIVKFKVEGTRACLSASALFSISNTGVIATTQLHVYDPSAVCVFPVKETLSGSTFWSAK